MGKNKFIDKKKAKTYALVYKSTAEPDSNEDCEGASEPEEQRVLHEYGTSRELPEEELERFREKQGHPLEWLMEERGLLQRKNVLDEKKRHELIELGFDDDGYDYLQHLKTLDANEKPTGNAHLEEVRPQEEEAHQEEKLIISEKRLLYDIPGAHQKESDRVGSDKDGVFVKSAVAHVPEEDVAHFDASQLTVIQQVDDEDGVTGMMGGVTAFAKKSDVVREKKDYEITELEKMMEEAEKNTDKHERVLGDGDLLDDFILTATLMGHDEKEPDEDVTSCPDSYIGSYSDYEGSSGNEDDDERPSQTRGRPGSIASTYWREERQDRKNLLSVIDEKFEHLAIEYDEDELGDMDELAEEIQGVADVEDFENILDEFIKEHPQKNDANSVRHKLFLAEEMDKHGFGNEHADIAIKMAKEFIRRAEQAENDNDKPASNAHIEIDPHQFQKEQNKWDCESILSLRSNIYNHPGTIEDTARKPPKTIALNKDGLPVGYMPKREFVPTKLGDEDIFGGRRSGAPAPIRKKDESTEEKKSRKAAVKAAKREARANKKEMKVLFAKERTKASKRDAQAQVQPTIIM